MPNREQVDYFGAGPAPLPTSVLTEASRNLLSYKDSGIGLAEISHRSSDANEILANAKAALVELLSIPDDYEVLFMQAGGSGEFSAVVYNLVGVWVQRMQDALDERWKGTEMVEASDEKKLEEYRKVTKEALRLEYLVTGSWSLKASQEAAKLVGEEHVHIITDARKHNDGKFGLIPEESTWNTELKATHDSIPASLRTPALTYYCDNETVDGVEFPSFPRSLEPHGENHDRLVVADMSSNFLSRKIDVSKYAVIFGGAQKNVGSTGITIVIVRKSLLPPQQKAASSQLLRSLGLPNGPVVLDYATIAKNNSLYNTLPIFDVWIAGRVMADLVTKHATQRIGGQEAIADKKANLLYSTIEKYPDVYQIVPAKPSRSRMNICMRVRRGDAETEKAFLKGAEAQYLMGLKGHRSVGGIRISNYNAVELKAVEKLLSYLDSFARAPT